MVINPDEPHTDNHISSTKSSETSNNLFERNGFEINKPWNLSFDNQLKEYLSQLSLDSSKLLNIACYYNDNENNPSIFPNLGIARANQVKQLFVDKGIAPDRIKITGEQGKNGSVQNLVDFIYISKTNLQNIDEYRSMFEHNPIILYFKSDSDKLLIDNNQRENFLLLSEYLDKDPSLKLDISGHTDATGSREKNVALSRERANFVKEKLLKNGIRQMRINVLAFGPDRPIVTNATKEGRAKNRRVEISVE